MPTIDEMLASTELTDDIKLQAGNQEFTVGQLRSYAAATSAAAAASAKAQREFEVKSREAADARLKAEQLGKDALALWEATEKERVAGPAARAAGDIDWENDPVYRPINARLSKIEKESIAAIDTQLKQLKEGLAAGFGFITSEYNQRRWDAIPADQRPKDKSWRDFTDEAKRLNLKDSYGLDDPIEAFTRSTAADRKAAELAAAEKRGEDRGVEKGRRAAAAATLPRPGGVPGLPPSAKQTPFKDMKSAMDAASQDPEILRIMNGDGAVA